MTTEQQIKNVIAYIGTHFEEKLTLDQLSKIACLSKYHFHRLFTVYTGLSLHQYVRWLRLKRAAHQLLVYKDKSIIEIAIHAGFESHEAFTRAFKLSCGLSPSEFRLHPYWHVWEMPSHGVHHQGKFEMNIEIRTLKEKRLAVLEHYGVPEQLGQSVHQLLSWAASRMINVRPQEAFGIAYDDPQNTPAEEFRFDLALTVPAQIKLEGMIIEKFLPAGRYAVASHKGSRENIGDTVYSMYRDWLPSSGETLGEQPCVFCYHNFEHETPETELITECRLLLR